MTDLRQAAQAVIDRWDSPLWKNGSTADAITALRTALEQQQSEPVAWIAEVELSVFARTPKEKTTVEIWKKPVLDSDVAIYTAPPQRKPLTDGEFAYVWHQETRRIMGTDKALLLRAKQITEAAHGIKEGT